MSNKLFNKNFILVALGQIVSLFGNAILRFALPLYLLRETGSPALFGIVTACSFLPMIIFSFMGGILADRLNKRNIMVVLDFITAITVIVLYFALGNFSLVPLLIVILMILYGIGGTYQPTVQSSIPFLVIQEHILPASAVINQISALAGLIGPVLGGVMFGAFGIYPILIVSIICFFLSSFMEVFIDMPFEKRNDNIGVIAIIKGDISESFNYLRHEKPMLFKIIILVCIFNLVLTSMMIVGMPIIIIQILNLSDELLGLSQGILALGGLLGGILTAILSKKLKLSDSYKILLACSLMIFVMAAPLLLQLSTMASFVIITFACFLIMSLATVFSVQMIATVQIETPPSLVGKVIALMMAMCMCAQPVGQALYGFAFDIFSDNSGYILLFAAILSFIITFVSKKLFIV